MAIPNLPWVFQVAWVDDYPSGRWEHPYTNYLTRFVTVDTVRNVVHTQLQPDTLQVVAYDPDRIVKPLKTSSPLWPLVRRGVKCRLLVRKPDLSFKTAFYGTIDNLSTDSPDRVKPTVTLDINSPMVTLNDTKVVVPSLAGNPLVWDPAGLPLLSTLGALLNAAQMDHSPNFMVDPVGISRYGGPWGGGQVSVGQALADMAEKAQVILYVEFLLPATDSDPHWRVRWRQPQPGATPTVSWDWTQHTLEQKPVLKYGAEVRG